MKRAFEILNSCVVEEGYKQKKTILNAYPKTIVFDVTNRCNYHCPLCPTGSGKSGRPIGKKKKNLAIKIIDECAEYVECFTFGFSGEPLLYNDLIELIRYASDKGIKTKLFTVSFHIYEMLKM